MLLHIEKKHAKKFLKPPTPLGAAPEGAVEDQPTDLPWAVIQLATMDGSVETTSGSEKLVPTPSA